MTLIHT